MLFIKSLFALALVAPAFSAPTLEVRDLATINAQITIVQTALADLDTSVKALTPQTDPAAATSTLTTKSKVILDALTNGATAISGTAAVSLTDALGLTSTTQALTNQANGTITSLIAAKPIIANAGQIPLVLSQLNDQKAATQKFGDAIASKVPDIAKAVAQGITTTAVGVVQRGIDAYSA